MEVAGLPFRRKEAGVHRRVRLLYLYGSAQVEGA